MINLVLKWSANVCLCCHLVLPSDCTSYKCHLLIIHLLHVSLAHHTGFISGKGTTIFGYGMIDAGNNA